MFALVQTLSSVMRSANRVLLSSLFDGRNMVYGEGLYIK